MSDPGENNEPVAFIKYLESSKHLFKTVRSFDYKKFFQDIITFLSIIGNPHITQSHTTSSPSRISSATPSKGYSR